MMNQERVDRLERCLLKSSEDNYLVILREDLSEMLLAMYKLQDMLSKRQDELAQLRRDLMNLPTKRITYDD